MFRSIAAAGLVGVAVLSAAACSSGQTPLQKCESAMKTAIDNGAALTSGPEPQGVKTNCSSLSDTNKAKAIAYAETYYASKHGGAQ
jgi:hypothetical protein